MSARAKAPTVRLATDEYRWSLASRCPRQAVLHRRQAEARPRSTREDRILARGRLFEQLVADQMAQQYGEDNVHRQREFRWPGGTGHTDVFVITEQAAMEIKSSTAPEGLLEHAILQNAGEQLFTDGCERGGVVLVDPTDLTQRLVPVNAQEVRGKVDAIVEQLAWAEDTGGLPACVCGNPTECRFNFCQYTDVAWAGWEAPAPEHLDPTEALPIVRDLARMKRECKTHEEYAETAKAAVKDLEAHLTELGVQPGREYVVGAYKLRRIATTGKTTFQLKPARVAGIFGPEDEERFAPFITLGKGSEYYRVDQIAEDAERAQRTDPDVFGEDVPF